MKSLPSGGFFVMPETPQRSPITEWGNPMTTPAAPEPVVPAPEPPVTEPAPEPVAAEPAADDKYKAIARAQEAKYIEAAKERDALLKEKEEAERAKLDELGKAQKDAADAKAALEAAQAAQKAAELDAMRTRIGAEKKLPAALVARLQGDDETSIAADADAILAAIPKGDFPDLGQGNSGSSSALTQEAAGKLSPAEYEKAVKDGLI